MQDMHRGRHCSECSAKAHPARMQIVHPPSLLQVFDLIKAGIVENFTILPEKLIINNAAFGFAVNAAFKHTLVSVEFCRSVVKSFNDNISVFVKGELCNTVNRLPDLVDISHSLTRYADCVNLFSVEPVFGKQLIKAVAVARFQKTATLPASLRVSLTRYFEKFAAQKPL